MAEEQFEEAELGMLKNSTAFLPPTHTSLLPWLNTGEYLRIGVSLYPYCWCWKMSGSQSLFVFLHALELSQSFFFLPHWSPFHHLLNVSIFSNAQTHHSLCGVSACRLLCLIISILVTLSSQLIPITLFTRAFQRHSAWSECFTCRKIAPAFSFEI